MKKNSYIYIYIYIYIYEFTDIFIYIQLLLLTWLNMAKLLTFKILSLLTVYSLIIKNICIIHELFCKYN